MPSFKIIGLLVLKNILKVSAVYSHGGHLYNLSFPSLIGHAVAEMFEYFGHVHVYSPRAGADKPLGTKCFHEYKSSVPLHAHREFLPI